MSGVAKFLIGAIAVGASFLIPGIGPVLGGRLAALLFTTGITLVASAINTLLVSGRQATILENTCDSTAPLPVVYGKARIGVRLADIRTSGDDNKYLNLVCCLCHGSSDGGGIQAIDEIYFNDELAVDASGVIQSPYTDRLTVSKYLGTDTQTADGTLTGAFGTGDPVPWPATSDGIGIAYLRLRLEYDTAVYTGIPQITAVVRGCRVLDPRTATWGYSTNPALCIYDYLTSTRYGLGAPTSELDTASFNAMADYYDETISVPNAYPTAGTQNIARFSCDGVLETGAPLESNLSMLLSSCRGNVLYQEGTFRLLTRRGGQSAALTLTEDDILGGWSFSVAGTAESPNFTTFQWVEPADLYAARQARWPAPGASNSYLTDDNGYETVREVSFPMVTNRYRAEQMAIVELQEARDSLQVQVSTTLRGLLLQVGDVVAVTHATPAWSGKLFWVMGVAFDASGPSVRLALLEYNSAAYTVAAQSQAIPSPNTNLSLPTYEAPYPTLPTDTTQDDGAGERKLQKGYQSGTALDGDTVTFSPAFQNAPKTRVSGGRTYDSGLTSPIYEDKRFTNLTAAGGTIVARLRSPGSPTTRNHDFAANLLDAAAEAEAITLSNAPANNDTYTVLVHTRIVLRSKYGNIVSGTVMYAIDSSSDSGSNWTQRATETVIHTTESTSDDPYTEARATAISVSGLDSTDQLRIRFLSFSVVGATLTATGEVRGANNGSYAGRGVTYITSTDTTVAATATGFPVKWEAWDG